MKNTCLLLGVISLLLSCAKETTVITVTNPSEFDRKEVVEVPAGDVKALFADIVKDGKGSNDISKGSADISKGSAYLLKDDKGQEVAYQLLAGGGLLFEAQVPAKSSVSYHLQAGKPSAVMVKTMARFVPERKDDFAWENDLAAYRMYGPALANEYPSNGVDVWMKCADEPVMDKFYAYRLDEGISYHENQGLGLDCYDVRHTMGAGGIAPYTSKLWIGDHFDRYEIHETGALRSVFTLFYDSVKLDNTFYQESITITTTAGSMLNKAVVRYKGKAQPMQLAGGIYLHQGDGATFYDKENRVIAYAEDAVSNTGVPEGRTYIGVYMPNATESITEDNHYAILGDYQVGDAFTYYFGGGWSKWKFASDEDWFNALVRFSQSRRQPLQVTVNIPKNYRRMSDAEMQRNPESWMLDYSTAPKWNYCHGLVLLAIQKTYAQTGDRKYYDYVLDYCDTMLLDNGKQILTYRAEDYNIDLITPGRILFPLYKETGDEKYRHALTLLRNQMRTHSRTADGGFWHKQIYPHQMWLDGIYMASPFLAEYACVFNEPELLDEVAHQITLIASKTYDKETGLYYHGWDEKHIQLWANPETGQSPNFWSRSIGWYAMAIVDVLDFLPENHPKRPEIIRIISELSASLEQYRDKQTGMWYQVTDKAGEAGNYLESSGSIMFIYAWVKGAQQGYLDSSYLQKGETAYRQFVKQFITDTKGTLNVTHCCAVAGLGGKDNRDGSYAYYLSEPVRDNDPKATGPFILTSLLLNE